jgi:hypothetical protein
MSVAAWKGARVAAEAGDLRQLVALCGECVPPSERDGVMRVLSKLRTRNTGKPKSNGPTQHNKYLAMGKRLRKKLIADGWKSGKAFAEVQRQHRLRAGAKIVSETTWDDVFQGNRPDVEAIIDKLDYENSTPKKASLR